MVSRIAHIIFSGALATVLVQGRRAAIQFTDKLEKHKNSGGCPFDEAGGKERICAYMNETGKSAQEVANIINHDKIGADCKEADIEGLCGSRGKLENDDDSGRCPFDRAGGKDAICNFMKEKGKSAQEVAEIINKDKIGAYCEKADIEGLCNIESGEAGASGAGCDTSVCNGKHKNRKGATLQLSNCQATAGHLQMEGRVITPSEVSGSFGLDAGSYICKEVCDYTWQVGGDRGSGSRLDVIRTADVRSPHCENMEE